MIPLYDAANTEPVAWVAEPCGHDDAVPVTSLAGDVVAEFCPTCDVQLPVGWRPKW